MTYSWNQLALCRELINLIIEDPDHPKIKTFPKNQIIDKVATCLNMPIDLVVKEVGEVIKQKEKGPSVA